MIFKIVECQFSILCNYLFYALFLLCVQDGDIGKI